jgi:hypothetical protein
VRNLSAKAAPPPPSDGPTPLLGPNAHGCLVLRASLIANCCMLLQVEARRRRRKPFKPALAFARAAKGDQGEPDSCCSSCMSSQRGRVC